mmetsp:Transcript_10848/g.23124  ORF Transcript_10848/g.23124 Transcript_10848/m.23124 type:complete len:273 (+) Transcript_10848:2468-3286(+)
METAALTAAAATAAAEATPELVTRSANPTCFVSSEDDSSMSPSWKLLMSSSLLRSSKVVVASAVVVVVVSLSMSLSLSAFSSTALSSSVEAHLATTEVVELVALIVGMLLLVTVVLPATALTLTLKLALALALALPLSVAEGTVMANTCCKSVCLNCSSASNIPKHNPCQPRIRSASWLASFRLMLKRALYPEWPPWIAAELAEVATAARRRAGPAGVNKAAAPATPRAAPTKEMPPAPSTILELVRSLAVNRSANSRMLGAQKVRCMDIRV